MYRTPIIDAGFYRARRTRYDQLVRECDPQLLHQARRARRGLGDPGGARVRRRQAADERVAGHPLQAAVVLLKRVRREMGVRGEEVALLEISATTDAGVLLGMVYLLFKLEDPRGDDEDVAKVVVESKRLAEDGRQDQRDAQALRQQEQCRNAVRSPGRRFVFLCEYCSAMLVLLTIEQDCVGGGESAISRQVSANGM